MPHTNIESTVRQRARGLRKSRTLGEKAMQEYLRALRPLGAHFRREVPIGPYIVDFAWLSANLVIEVDGASPDLEGRAQQDGERDRFLRGEGYNVIRVRDADAIANSMTAFAPIEEALRELLGTPPPAASRQPPPHKGEGDRQRRGQSHPAAASPQPPSPQGGGDRQRRGKRSA